MSTAAGSQSDDSADADAHHELLLEEALKRGSYPAKGCQNSSTLLFDCLLADPAIKKWLDDGLLTEADMIKSLEGAGFMQGGTSVMGNFPFGRDRKLDLVRAMLDVEAQARAEGLAFF